MAKQQYLKVMRFRYRKLTRRIEKTQMLDEICATSGYDRKYVIRFLPSSFKKGPKTGLKRGRKSSYGKPELKVLKTIWLAANLPGPVRLNATIPLWLPGYEARDGALDIQTSENLERISSASIGRLMAHTRLSQVGRGRSTTKPGSLLRQNIPIQTGQWEESRPGIMTKKPASMNGFALL